MPRRAQSIFWVAVVTGGGFVGGLEAQEVPSDPQEQIRLALTAAPAHVRSAASVHVLGEGGYRLAREGSNGFHCLLERWNPEVLTPICYDGVGAESTLQTVFFLEQRRAEGVPEAQVTREIEEGYRSGRFKAPTPPGVAYMLSSEGPAPPHVMYYAPYATNEAFVGAEGADRGVLPFIYEPGGPRAYIVQLVDPAALRRTERGGR